MKKTIAICMALLLSLVIAPVSAQTDFTLYADIYGITVSFASEVLQENLTSVTLTEFVSKQEVSLDQELSDDGLTLTLTPQDSGRLTPDLDYILSINEEKKGVCIQTETNVDFSGLTLGNITSHLTELKGTKGLITIIRSGSDRYAEVANVDGDNKLFLRANGGFGTGTDANMTDYTISYKAELYGTTATQATGRTFWHAQSVGSNTTAINLNYSNNSSEGRIDIVSTAVSPGETAGAWISPVKVTATSTATKWEDMGTVTRMSPAREVTFKSVGNIYSAQIDGAEVISIDVSDSKYDSARKKGFFYHVANANCAELIDDVLLTTSVTFDVEDEVELEVDSIYADTQGIVLKVSGGTLPKSEKFYSEAAILNYATMQEEVIGKALLLGDTIRLSAALSPDVIYGLRLSEGFGGMFANLGSEYNKVFEIRTVAANDFQELSAGGVTSGSSLGDGFAVSGVGQVAEMVSFEGDNKLFLAGGASMTQNKRLTNYTISFDAEAYGINNNTDTYYVYFVRNSSVGGSDGYGLRPHYATLQLRNHTANPVGTVATATYTNMEKWIPTLRNQMVRYIQGTDTLPDGTVKATTYAEMGITTRASSHTVALRAVGNEFSAFRDGVFLASVSDDTLSATSGYFRLYGNNYSAQLMDNFLITEFVERDDIAVMFDGELEVSYISANEAECSVKALNIAGGDIDCIVVLAAYRADHKMLDCISAPLLTSSLTVSETLSSAEDIAYVKAFAIDSYENLNQYCKSLKKER